ncbi:hypothetical protein F4813DRAFT_368843 [Daldinia decipiens]|uniref:uncharacterized protein n=1 Tax=Daldinia decipiens TaxID=326647 RepID=UPI0020C2A83C|nr:uncharacterized protein F4813DRAFT_368843 [Daldinia decipiens]KAI1654903.1 hypothetical protein F4813DRAFT_368843 [Daldinia decipiens]
MWLHWHPSGYGRQAGVESGEVSIVWAVYCLQSPPQVVVLLIVRLFSFSCSCVVFFHSRLNCNDLQVTMARPMLFCLQLVLFHFAYTTLAVLNHCYYPNRKEAEDDSPCNPDSDSSACCGGSIGTVCLSNGLCQGPNGAVIRGSCSDMNWDSGNCANYCLGASLGGTDLISCANVTKDDTSYCCNGAENCCDSGDGRFSVGPHNPTTSATWNAASTKFIVVGITSTSTSTTSATTPTTPTISSTSATSTKDSTTSASGSTTPSAASYSSTNGVSTNTGVAFQPDITPSSAGTAASSSSDLSDGAKAGIGIGAVIGVLLIIGLVYALWRLQKMNKMLAKEQPGNQYGQIPVHPTSQVATSQIATAPNGVNVAPPVPPKSEGQISELYGHYSPLHELPAEST